MELDNILLGNVLYFTMSTTTTAAATTTTITSSEGLLNAKMFAFERRKNLKRDKNSWTLLSLSHSALMYFAHRKSKGSK